MYEDGHTASSAHLWTYFQVTIDRNDNQSQMKQQRNCNITLWWWWASITRHNTLISQYSQYSASQWCDSGVPWYQAPGPGLPTANIPHSHFIKWPLSVGTDVWWSWSCSEPRIRAELSWVVQHGVIMCLVISGTHHGHICQLGAARHTFQCRSKEASNCTPRTIHTKSHPITMNIISILYDTNTLVEHLNTGHTVNDNETRTKSKNSTIINLLLPNYNCSRW